MPTANYSHMVMVMELMVDGDDGGGDGGEDGLRIPPPEEKSWIDLSSGTPSCPSFVQLASFP